MTLPANQEFFDRRLHLRWVTGRTAIARERWITIAAVLATVATSIPVAYDSVRIALRNILAGAYLAASSDLFMMVLAGLVSYGALVYLLARIGHLERLHGAAVASDLVPEDEPDHQSALLALVPSYCEDPHVVRRAVISAALQPHRHRRVVLLIDDIPTDPPTASLEAVRTLPGHVAELMRPMRDYCELALRRFDQRTQAADIRPTVEARYVADLYAAAADWFEAQAQKYPTADLADAFFVDVTFHTQAVRWRRAAQRWAELADGRRVPPSSDRLRGGYLRVLDVFCVEITSFERKRFANLSHAPSKAMNINSYLGLLGGSYRWEQSAAGLLLSPCGIDDADLIVPDAEFVLILDADTIVAPDYTPTLMRRLCGPGGQRLAVVQSPYSTFPGDRGVLERIAGAQTDIQYLVHQGLTYYNATYWVGANALVRVAALRDLMQTDIERGFEIVKFIRDRTLIEDTESTIDLVRKGWQLLNHAERLAFSVTPPDFGSLLIQRRRWANGGLLIVPKLLAHLRQPGNIAARLKEGFMRLHYLISLGPVSMAALVALGLSFDKDVRTTFLLGTGLVYYAAYARDLHLLGYRWHDIFRVVALNLVLIPINIVGMMLSVFQGISGRKPRFSRTPKVHDRTRVPAGYLVAELALLTVWCELSISRMIRTGSLGAVLMLVHAALFVYAFGAFIGFRNSGADLAAALVRRHRGIPARAA